MGAGNHTDQEGERQTMVFPDVDEVISNLRVIRTWASCGAITRGDCPSVTKILDDALALIEAQRKTLDEIDKYVRELDRAVNGNG